MDEYSFDDLPFKHPSLSLPAEFAAVVFPPLYERLRSAGALTSAGKVVHRICGDIWPDYQVVYHEEVLNDMLRVLARFRPPLFITERVQVAIVEMNTREAEIVAGSSMAEYWAAVFRHAALFQTVGWAAHPHLAAVVELLRNSSLVDKPSIRRMLEPDMVAGFHNVGWKQFVVDLHCALLLDWVSLVIDEDGEKLVYHAHGGRLVPLHEDDRPLLYEGIYPYDEASELALKLLEHVMPFEGPAGNLVVLHANDRRSLNLLNAADAVIKEAPADVPLILSLWERVESSGEVKRQIRDLELLKLKSWGLSQRRIAEELLAQGHIEPAWAEGRDAVESAERQVRRIWAKKLKRKDQPHPE